MALETCRWVTPDRIRQAHERRAVRQVLRNVSRLLRISAVLLIVLGVAGLLLGSPSDWWTGPSWFSLIVGALLFGASIVQRVRRARRDPNSLSSA